MLTHDFHLTGLLNRLRGSQLIRKTHKSKKRIQEHGERKEQHEGHEGNHENQPHIVEFFWFSTSAGGFVSSDCFSCFFFSPVSTLAESLAAPAKL